MVRQLETELTKCSPVSSTKILRISLKLTIVITLFSELTLMLVTKEQIGQPFIVQHSKDMAKLS